MYAAVASWANTFNFQNRNSRMDYWYVREVTFSSGSRFSLYSTVWSTALRAKDAITSCLWLRTDCVCLSVHFGEKQHYRHSHETEPWVCCSDFISTQKRSFWNEKTNGFLALAKALTSRTWSTYNAWLVIWKVCYVLLSFGAFYIIGYSFFERHGIEGRRQNKASHTNSSISIAKVLRPNEHIDPLKWGFSFIDG